jgi:adenylyltransferase/sulfurtransferase
MDAERYARSLVLPGWGPDAQAKLAAARVLVIGAGGLGSTVLPALAAAGVGTLGIVDDDHVETSNLARQTIHTSADLGRSKAQSAADRIAALNPAVSVELHELRLETSNALELFEDYDLIVDGSDGVETRYLANDAAVLVGVPMVWGSVSQYGGIAGVAWAERGPHYRDLYPEPPDDILTCEDGGVLPTVVATIGSIMATEALKIIAGVGEPLIGRAVVVDALGGTFREVAYERTPFVDRDPFEKSDASRPEPVTSPFPLVDESGAPRPARGITNGGRVVAEPDHPESLMPAELASRFHEVEDGSVQLVDVREPWEAEIVQLPGSVLVPLGTVGSAELDPGRPIIVYCHHGVRSEQARRILSERGYAVSHLAGGIDAYARSIDPGLPRY